MSAGQSDETGNMEGGGLKETGVETECFRERGKTVLQRWIALKRVNLRK